MLQGMTAPHIEAVLCDLALNIALFAPSSPEWRSVNLAEQKRLCHMALDDGEFWYGTPLFFHFCIECPAGTSVPYLPEVNEAPFSFIPHGLPSILHQQSTLTLLPPTHIPIHSVQRKN